MSVYFIKKKGWRYDFTLNQRRYTGAWFKTKREAKRKEARRRELLLTQRSIPTDTDFSVLVNRRLDHVKAWNSKAHYVDYRYLARKWVDCWDGVSAGLSGWTAAGSSVMGSSAHADATDPVMNAMSNRGNRDPAGMMRDACWVSPECTQNAGRRNDIHFWIAIDKSIVADGM